MKKKFYVKELIIFCAKFKIKICAYVIYTGKGKLKMIGSDRVKQLEFIQRQ